LEEQRVGLPTPVHKALSDKEMRRSASPYFSQDAIAPDLTLAGKAPPQSDRDQERKLTF
jgi:hypothetical protein